LKNILFVDDEPMVLDGLRNVLHPLRREWHMEFVASGEAALACLATSPFDVIVSDMRMPRMDGATLLRQVQHDFPCVVRIVLSGHAELEAAVRAVPIAQQFLTKPCEVGTLRGVIERACSLNALLADPVLRGTLGELSALPSAPWAYVALTRTLAEPTSSLRDVSRIIESDIAMCARILQLVNSSFFGIPRRITSVREAVTYLGTSMIRNLVLSMETFKLFQPAPLDAPFSLEALQRRSLLAAAVARRLLPDRAAADDAFTAATLADLGQLILATHLPEGFARALHRARTEQRPLHVVEAELPGAGHAEVGAYLLGLWGLPNTIVEAVAHHHAPMRVPHDRLEVIDAVAIATTLAAEQVPSWEGGSYDEAGSPDLGYLEVLGIEKELPRFRAIAAEESARSRM
jgi:HD-like signal output (HDOD) protein